MGAIRPYCDLINNNININGHKVVQCVSSPIQPRDDDPPNGYEYEPGLRLVMEPEDGTEYNWRSDALCHGEYDTFDLVSLTGEDTPEEERAEIRRINAYKLKASRAICFECPVFQECWDEAWTSKHLPYGVIRAGAKLSNASDEVRGKAMMRAMVLYQEYQEEKEWSNGG